MEHVQVHQPLPTSLGMFLHLLEPVCTVFLHERVRVWVNLLQSLQEVIRGLRVLLPLKKRQQQDKRQAVQLDSLAACTIVPTFTINYYNPSFSKPRSISNSHSSVHGGSMEI